MRPPDEYRDQLQVAIRRTRRALLQAEDNLAAGQRPGRALHEYRLAALGLDEAAQLYAEALNALWPPPPPRPETLR